MAEAELLHAGRPKAADIPDAAMLAVLTPQWQCWWTIAEHFPAFPPKVVQAKLRQLLKRDLAHGCPCGCRGDWHLPDYAEYGQCPCGIRPRSTPPA